MLEDGALVGVAGQQLGRGGRCVGTVEALARGPDLGQHVAGVHRPPLVQLTPFGEALAGEVADGPQELEAQGRARVERADEAVVDEGAQTVEHGHGGARIGADLLGALEPERPGEHAEPVEQGLVLGIEQAVAPLERRPEGAVPVGEVLAPADQHAEAVDEAGPQVGGPQDLAAGGGELDGER